MDIPKIELLLNKKLEIIMDRFVDVKLYLGVNPFTFGPSLMFIYKNKKIHQFNINDYGEKNLNTQWLHIQTTR